MNRRIPREEEADPVRQIGLQTILLGMEATLEANLRAINDVRAQLGHPQVSVLRGVVQTDQEGTTHQDLSALSAPRQLQAAAEVTSRRSLAGKGVGKMWAQRKAILEAAGMVKKGSGLPSNKLIAKAERKLRRLGKPIPGETPEKAEKPEKPEKRKRRMSAAARKRIVLAQKKRWAEYKKTTGNQAKAVLSQRVIGTLATAKKAPAKPAPEKKHSKKALAAIAGSAKADWALAKRAGLSPKTRPDRKMLDLAREILKDRSSSRKAKVPAKSKAGRTAKAPDTVQQEAAAV